MNKDIHPIQSPSKSIFHHQAIQVLMGLGLGIVVGGLLHEFLKGQDKSALTLWIHGFQAVSDIFMRLIKMIIAPLVLSTLVAGMAHLGGGKALGRVGGKAIGWFFSASLLSLLLGLILANLLAPGKGLHLPLPPASADPMIKGGSDLSLSGFISHLIPTSITGAMAENEILQIVVFSVFFGLACAQLGELANPVVRLIDALSHIMLKMTSYVMKMAPFAVFAAIAAVITEQGLAVIESYGVFLIDFSLALVCLWVLLTLIGAVFLGARIKLLLRHIREPMLLAFGTASSEAAYPLLMRELGRYGCPEPVTGLVLPLGYSFNLDGSMLYMTFAVLFIAQAYGIEIPFTDQVLMMLVLLFTSKGVAGVPRASLIVISATLSLFHIPEAGLLLLLGIDQILDMARSATNVLGNSIATAVISRSESKQSFV
jgi:Na+/H+-dicarboxylate symporter